MSDLTSTAEVLGIGKIQRHIFLCAIFVAGACLPSCDKAKHQITTRDLSRPAGSDQTSDPLSRERLLAEERMREIREAAIEENKPPSPAALEEVFQSASRIIQEKKLTPESEGAEKLESNLTVMLRNGDARIYDLISLLPPGSYSESIVRNAFMRAHFPDLKSVFDACAPIKEKDLHRAAINGSAGTLKSQVRMGGTAVNVTRGDIEQLRAAGFHDLNSMIVQGVAAGNLDTADIVAEINDRDNLMLSAALNELPPVKAKEVFIEALRQEKRVGPEAVHWLALSLFRDNPTEAVSWFSGFPQETAVRGTRSVIKEWMAADSLAASAFVGGMSSGPPKDAAMAVIVSDCLLNGDQEAATGWAKEISDDELREKTQTRILDSKKR